MSVNINDLLTRAAALRDETALNSISPDRAGGIMYDTLLAMNELWLQQGSALVISKIYASVAAMEADSAPVSDLTGQPLRPGQIVVIASSDSDNGSVYRYDGTEDDTSSWSEVGTIGGVPVVDSLDSDSSTLPLAARQGKVLDGKVSQLQQFLQEKISPGYYFEFRKRFIANGYFSPVNGYSCTSIFEGDGSEYIFPSTSGHCTYKVFQYVSDAEGIEITNGWQNAELRFNITGKFVVTFNGTFTEQDKSVYEWLVANWRLGGYDAALEPRMEFLENSSVLDIMNQGASLVGKTKNKEIYIPLPEFYTKNLLNLEDADVMLGYRQYSDTPQQDNSYNLSGYIPITPGVTYCYSTSNTTYPAIQYHAVFDKNRNFIRGGIVAITTFTAQPGDAFVRITLRAAAWGKDNQFEVGTTPTEYEPFGVQFKYPRILVPEIVMPSIVYTTKGVQNSIYHKNYCNFLTDNFLVASYRNYAAAKWEYLDRCFRTTDGSQTIEMRLYCKSPFKLLNGVSVQSVVGDPATDNGVVNVLCIGDSFTYDGRYLQQIADICPNINLVGMRKPAQNIQSDSIRCEGRGGWTLEEYTEPFADLTPSHMQPFSPFIQADGYNYYGATPFWAAIVNGTSQYGYGTNGFDDYKSWFGADGYKLNPSVNDLMYDGTSFKYWDGTSWTALSTAPTFTFDFAKYISIWQIPAPDMVFVFLGKNDFHSGVADWDAFKANLDSLIASIHSYDSNIIIGVCTPTTADEAANNSDNVNKWLAHMNMWNARKLMIKNYDNLSTSRVFIVDTGTTLDPDYGFVLEERPPFAFYEGNERELFATNGVHPSGAGYKQIGTCIAGFIQAKR